MPRRASAAPIRTVLLTVALTACGAIAAASPSLQELVNQSDELVRAGRLADSNRVLTQALDLARQMPGGALEEASVLERLATNEGRRGRVPRANSMVADALRLREKHFGKDSPEFAAALLRSADWYRLTGDFGRELAAERQAVGILQARFGARDPRLAIPLIRLATARIAQRTRSDEAEAAMQRAIGLEFGPGPEDAYIKAEVLATTADLRVVFGTPADSGLLYRAAWQVLAGHGGLGATAANRYFGRVRQLHLAIPDDVATIGTIDLGYTVTAAGTVDDVRILDNAVPAMDGGSEAVRSTVGAASWNAMRRSRYRPRVVDGEPVATTSLRFSTEFCLDQTDIVPICKAKANASVVP